MLYMAAWITIHGGALLSSKVSHLLLTVDWEDYYHICDQQPFSRPENWGLFPSRLEHNTFRVLDLLAELGARATFFVIGRLAERFPSLIQAITRDGHEVAWHGQTHTRWDRLSPRELEREWFDGLKRFSDRFGISIRGFRAPMWSLTPELLRDNGARCEAEGLVYDSSLVPLTVVGQRGYPRIPSRLGSLLELPPTIVNFLGLTAPVTMSWGFRWLPWYYVRLMVWRFLRTHGFALLALHPWELDPSQPQLALSKGIYFTHYMGLANTEARLRRFLKRHQVIPCFDFAKKQGDNGRNVPDFSL